MRVALLVVLAGALLGLAAACNGGGGDLPGTNGTAAPPGTDPAAVPSATPFGQDARTYTLGGDGSSSGGSPFGSGGTAGAPSGNQTSGGLNQSVGQYEIQPGDSLGAIAARFETTVEELERLNNITRNDILSVGQVLKVPGAPTLTGGSPTPSADGSLNAPEGEDGEEQPDQETEPEPSEGTYIVEDGDTCADIAAKLGVDVNELISVNGLPAACDTLQPGQQLTIP